MRRKEFDKIVSMKLSQFYIDYEYNPSYGKLCTEKKIEAPLFALLIIKGTPCLKTKTVINILLCYIKRKR